MRFLIAVIDHEGNPGSPGEMEAIDVFNDFLREKSHWIMACGVAGPSTATVIDNRDGLGSMTDGPLHDVDEFMSGFWLIEASNLAEAKDLALAGSKACNRKVELRPLLG